MNSGKRSRSVKWWNFLRKTWPMNEGRTLSPAGALKEEMVEAGPVKERKA
jgi:hypothetical protein